MDEPTNVDAASLPLEDRQEMGFLGTPTEPAVNAAGRPYDPATGRLLPAEQPVPEAPTEPNQQPTVTSHAKHSQDLYDAASYFGLAPEDADAVPAPQLRKMLREMTAAQHREQDAQARAKFWEEQRTQTTTQRQQPPVAAEEQFDLGNELDPSLNPKTHSLLKGIWEENKRLRKQMQEVDSTIKAQATTAFTQKVDRAIAKLAANDTYGEGEFTDFLPTTAEYAARVQAYKESGLTGNETSQAQIDKAIKKAHLFLESERPAKQVGYEVVGKEPPPPAKKPAPNGRITPEQWNGGGVGAPTRRAAEELPEGDAKAIAGVAAKMGRTTTQYDEDAEIKKTLLRRGAPAA